MADLDRLFRDYFTPLLRYLERQTGDRDSAEELVQETFVRAMRHELRTNERAWLFTTATNLLRDYTRRELRQRRHHEQIQHSELERERDLIRSAMETQPDLSPIQQALYSLGDRDRSALLLSEEGFSYDEIARMIGLSPQSVGTTLSRARKRVLQNYESLMRATQIVGGTNVES
ncbi:MAG: sigma-70 family RNA polymerase sigma factor [Gemmatimonadaceae bacterium]